MTVGTYGTGTYGAGTYGALGLVEPIYTVELATGAGANPTAWTEITQYVTGATWRRGRDDTLLEGQPGTATLRLRNDDGRFSPALASSPLYGNVASMRAIRIHGTHASITYNLFFGYIQSVIPEPLQTQQSCTISLADGSVWLSLAKSTPSYTNDRSDVEIGLALDSASWPAALRTLATGRSTFTPDYTDQEVLSQCNGIAVDNEGGLFYYLGNGHATFEDRHYRLLTSRSTTSQGTFTDASSLLDLRAERPARDIANEVKVTYAGGGTVTKTDSSSQTSFGPRRLEITASFLGATEASSRASWTLSQRKDEHDRPLVVVNGNKTSALMTHVLARVISDRITITDSNAKTGIDGDYFIESVDHVLSNPGSGVTVHTVTWQLSPVDAQSYWILGQSRLGATSPGVDTTRLAY